MTSDDGQQRKQIHLRTNKATKENWENFIEESDTVSSMSELVRHGVTTYIAEEQSDRNHPPDGSQRSVDGEYGPEIADGVQSIQAGIEDISDRLKSLERSSDRGNELENLAEDVFMVLPEAKPGTEEHEKIVGSPDTVRAWSGTLTDITKTVLMDASQRNRERITHALMRLNEGTSTVKSEEIDGERRHWKEVD